MNERKPYVLTKENIHRIPYSEERPKKEKEFCCKLCYNLPWRVKGTQCVDTTVKRWNNAEKKYYKVTLPGCGLQFQQERFTQADTEITLLKSNAGRDNFYGNWKNK